MIKKAWQILLEILFSPICIDCGRYLHQTEAQNALCKKCFESIEVFKVKPHPRLIAVGPYGNSSLRALIHGLKFKRFTHTLPQIKVVIERYIDQDLHDFTGYDLITYIPLHPKRERTRGFNQARLIADILGELIEVEIQPTIKRVRDTKAQTLIHGAHQRQKNVANCFSLVSSTVEGKRLLLVDDVYTSGATTKEATRMLLRAGVRGVTIFALAKAA